MQNIRVQITVPNVKRVVNLDVVVNGENRKIKYRVETFDFDQNSRSNDNIVSLLRKRIANYDQDWEVYHIGTPFNDKMPITFRYKR